MGGERSTVRGLLCLAALASSACRPDLPTPTANAATVALDGRDRYRDDVETPDLGAFTVSVEQASPRDATLELHWTRSLHAVRYRVSVATGETCLTVAHPADTYELTSTSVELLPLAPGTYAICVTAYDASDNGLDADNTGVPVSIVSAALE